LKYGACIFKELVGFSPLEGPSEEPWPFDGFYGSSKEKYSLATAIKVDKGAIPDTMIPIGHDGGPNQICLGVKGEDRDKVYFWDNDMSWAAKSFQRKPDARYKNVYLVAESFEDFICRLTKDQE
jgi:hypothetical protein